MKKKRLLYGALVPFLLSFLLAACGGDSASGSKALVLRQFDPPAEIGGLQKAVDAWNSAHADIPVRIETVTTDSTNQYTREVQAGGGPDIMQLGFVSTRDLAKAQLLTNLDSLIKSNPPGKGIDDFLGTDLATYNGSIYAIPWTVDTFTMVYHQDAFEQAGITTFPTTWDEFFTVAQKLTKDGRYGFCFPAASSSDSGIWFLLNYYLWSNGKSLVEKGSDGTYQVGASAEDLTQAINYFNSFIQKGIDPKSTLGIAAYSDAQLVNQVAQGSCAIGFFPPQTFRQAQKQSGGKLQTAPVPGGTKTRISHLGGRVLGINPHTKYPKEAWQFLNYLLSAQTFKTYDQYPAQKSLFDQLKFDKAEQGYVEALPKAITFNNYISSPVQVSSLQAMSCLQFGAAASGQKTVQRAGADLLASLKQALANAK
jgi:multiple sugar transport system substrate-binding protein